MNGTFHKAPVPLWALWCCARGVNARKPILQTHGRRFLLGLHALVLQQVGSLVEDFKTLRGTGNGGHGPPGTGAHVDWTGAPGG